MGGRRVYVLVRGSPRPGASETILRSLRVLLPAAVLLSSPAGLPREAEEDDAVVISIDADKVASGPLSLAHLIVRGR